MKIRWSYPSNTITYHAKQINISLMKCEQQILNSKVGFQFPRTHYFSSDSKLPHSDHFGLILDYRKMTKCLILSIGVHKHEQRTQTEPLKPKWLAFWDHGLRKTR